MDFWRAVQILNRRKWLILTSVVVTTLLTFLATRLVGSKWVATVRFVSKNPIVQNMNDPTASNPQDAARAQASMYEAVVKSKDVLETALTELHMSQLPPKLLESIKLEATGPRLFELAVTDSSPSR